MKTKLTASAIFGALLLSTTVHAVPDLDLHVNGHFRGMAQGYSPAPGWTLTADGGTANILPGLKPDKFRLELIAPAGRSQSVVSDLHQVFGNTIEIKADISGRDMPRSVSKHSMPPDSNSSPRTNRLAHSAE